MGISSSVAVATNDNCLTSYPDSMLRKVWLPEFRDEGLAVFRQLPSELDVPALAKLSAYCIKPTFKLHPERLMDLVEMLCPGWVVKDKLVIKLSEFKCYFLIALLDQSIDLSSNLIITEEVWAVLFKTNYHSTLKAWLRPQYFVKGKFEHQKLYRTYDVDYRRSMIADQVVLENFLWYTDLGSRLYDDDLLSEMYKAGDKALIYNLLPHLLRLQSYAMRSVTVGDVTNLILHPTLKLAYFAFDDEFIRLLRAGGIVIALDMFYGVVRKKWD